MGEALGVVSAGIQAVNKRNLEWDPYLDCLDNRRTVRAVASKQGSSVTIGEFYKGRDVTIVHGTTCLTVYELLQLFLAMTIDRD